MDCEDGLHPSPLSAQTITTTQIRIVFSEPLHPPSKDRFGVSTSAIKTISSSGTVVILTLENSFLPYQTPAITIYQGIRDLAGNEAPSTTLPTTDGIPNVAPKLTDLFISSENFYENEPLVLSIRYVDEDNDQPVLTTAKLIGPSASTLVLDWTPGDYTSGIVASGMAEGLSPGNYVVSFSASDGGAVVNTPASLSFTVAPVEFRNITLNATTTSSTIDPSDTREGSISFTIRNTGNIGFDAYLNTSIPETWGPSLPPMHTLGLDDTSPLVLHFTIPASLPQGVYNHTITAIPTNGGDGDMISFSVRVIRGEVAQPQITVEATTEGEETTITVVVENTGDGVLKGASIYIYDNGETVTFQDIPTIAPGDSVEIEVLWTPEKDGEHTISVKVLDGSQSTVSSTSTSVAGPTFSATIWGPGSAPAFLVALLLASLLWAIVLLLVVSHYRRRGKKEDAI